MRIRSKRGTDCGLNGQRDYARMTRISFCSMTFPSMNIALVEQTGNDVIFRSEYANFRVGMCVKFTG